MNTISKYFSEVILELKKVTWPKRNEVIQLLGLVLTVSFIVAVFVGGVDLGLTKILETLVK